MKCPNVQKAQIRKVMIVMNPKMTLDKQTDRLVALDALGLLVLTLLGTTTVATGSACTSSIC